MDSTAKALIVFGFILIAAGIGWHFGWIQSLKIGQLPGDIHIKRDNMQIYFPITTGLLIGALISLISWLFK
ncbi:DUF2905 domain-containing protein [Pseudobdellovibrio exovorus]|uniref:DUF2905 domain-containing protein n=1 Tax=Pseudobdellovibrio exovorus JSS TaxID=1184267 RepID=M4V5C8_9BACT|nr:DUF2905 domain-containing protein [Pseudobdellovibrio exovorus]AGH94532.1 hypothetical protein A11Q_312 [Pseudobdellovibrio exovorus JSS]